MRRGITGATALVPLTSIGLALALCVPARANESGIVGFSGKQGATCTTCHTGGVAPDIAFIGPSLVAPGETATFRFEVQSAVPNQRAAGLDIAVDAGTLEAIQGQGARVFAQVNELTHTAPKNNDDSGVAAWEFLWTAPDEPGTYTLYGAGNSVNRNSQNTGDRSAATTFAVEVALPPDTPTATPTPTEGPPTQTPTVTRTFGPVPCVGDCNDSGSVTVNELVVGVNIALGSASIDACLAFDTNDDGTVTVNELIAGVNAALGVCV